MVINPPVVGATILLAEDEPEVRAAIERMLKQGGYQVIAAGDGAQALALAGAHRGPIDLLISDVVMPRLGGAALARQLSAERPGLRVLFVSGYSWEGDLPIGETQGTIDFLQKPVDLESIHEEGRGAGRGHPVRRGPRSRRPRTVRPEINGSSGRSQEGDMRSMTVAFGFALALVACRSSDYVTDKYYQDAAVPGAGGATGGRGGTGGSRTGGAGGDGVSTGGTGGATATGGAAGSAGGAAGSGGRGGQRGRRGQRRGGRQRRRRRGARAAAGPGAAAHRSTWRRLST